MLQVSSQRYTCIHVITSKQFLYSIRIRKSLALKRKVMTINSVLWTTVRELYCEYDRSGRCDCSTWFLLVKTRVNNDSSAPSNISANVGVALLSCSNQVAGSGAETLPGTHGPLRSRSPTTLGRNTVVWPVPCT